MKKSMSVVSDFQAQIESRLAEALRSVPSETMPPIGHDADIGGLSSRDLLQMAWDKAEEELDILQAELRRLRVKHAEEERALLSRINEKKRLQRDLLERAPQQSARG